MQAFFRRILFEIVIVTLSEQTFQPVPIKVPQLFFALSSLLPCFSSFSLFSFQGAISGINSPGGGDKRIRTADPLLAKQVLSQLSYTPG